MVRSPDTGTTLVLSDDLPDEAYIALFEIDPNMYEGAYLLWDGEQDKWKDAMPGR